jgi:hypothetical protein
MACLYSPRNMSINASSPASHSINQACLNRQRALAASNQSIHLRYYTSKRQIVGFSSGNLPVPLFYSTPTRKAHTLCLVTDIMSTYLAFVKAIWGQGTTFQAFFLVQRSVNTPTD